MKLPVLGLLLLASSTLAINRNAPILPDPRLSPGDVLTTDTAMICRSGYTQTVRNVPQALKEQVYREYGIASREPGEYEIDHVISLELGGSNSVRNLFPESYKTQPLNAHVKDRLENRLHALACSGKITMQEAQGAIAGNWTVAYEKYLGPLPGGVSVVKTTQALSSAATSAAMSAAPVPVPPGPVGGGLPSTPLRILPNPDGSCPASAPIKVSRSGIYHLPQGDGSYTRTHARSCFRAAAAAQAAGYRGVK